MIYMKKKINLAVLLIAFILLFTVASCNKKTDNKISNSSPETVVDKNVESGDEEENNNQSNNTDQNESNPSNITKIEVADYEDTDTWEGLLF